MTTSLQEDLKKLGLTDNEVRVYLALVGVGSTRAADIIKATGMHRNLVYQALGELVSKRLATKTTQKGIFHFLATNPEHFRDEIHEREAVVARVIEQLKTHGHLNDQEITIYEGPDAIRTFSLKNARRLRRGECIHVLGSSGGKFEAAMGESALTQYFSDIAKYGGIKILAHRSQPYSSTTKKLLRRKGLNEIRFLPFDINPSVYVVFTNDNVAFHIYEKPMTVIEIGNRHLVQAYKSYFEQLWNQHVRIEQGIDALHDAFTDMIDELKPGEGYYVLGGNIGGEHRRMTQFFDEIHRYRIQRGVVAHILARNESAMDIRERNRQVGDPDEAISHEKTFHTPFLAPMQVNMVNGRAFMVLYKRDMPTVIFFEDKLVHDGFKLYFDEIWNRKVETMNGYNGIIQLCERVLEEGENLYHIAATGTILKTHTKYYAEFTKRRVAKNIQLHILANTSTRGPLFRKIPLCSVSYLPPEFASPMVVWIFGDYVANVLWHQPERIFLIHDAQTAEYYRQYYKALERIAKP